ENAYFQALAFEKGVNQPNRALELARLYEEAGKRYQAVIDKFPEFTHVHVARYGLAMVHYRKEEFEKAQKTLQAIPQDARQGDLALIPYLLADCILRLMPAKTEGDDAVAAGRALEEIQSATELLESF